MRALVFTPVLVIVLFLTSQPVEAETLNARLKGEYALAMRRSCVQNQDGFEPLPGRALKGLSGQAQKRVTTVESALTYNGTGTGISESLVFITRLPDLQSPISVSLRFCNITYIVAPDNSFVEELSCTFEGLVGPGVPAAGGGSIVGIVRQGQIGPRGEILLISDAEANVETLTGTPSGTVFKRICSRAGTAVKIVPVQLGDDGGGDD